MNTLRIHSRSTLRPSNRCTRKNINAMRSWLRHRAASDHPRLTFNEERNEIVLELTMTTGSFRSADRREEAVVSAMLDAASMRGGVPEERTVIMTPA